MTALRLLRRHFRRVTALAFQPRDVREEIRLKPWIPAWGWGSKPEPDDTESDEDAAYERRCDIHDRYTQ